MESLFLLIFREFRTHTQAGHKAAQLLHGAGILEKSSPHILDWSFRAVSASGFFA